MFMLMPSPAMNVGSVCGKTRTVTPYSMSGLRAVFPRQVERMLATTPANAEARITGGHMDEDGLARTVDHVLKRGRVHKQLPVVLVRGEIERDFVRPPALCGEGRRSMQNGSNDKTNSGD